MSAPPEISRNIQKQAQALFADAVQREAFLGALSRGGAARTAVAWLQHGAGSPIRLKQQAAAVLQAPLCAAAFRRDEHRPVWLPSWIEVAAPGERPGGLPQHDAGDFYCFDLSSAFVCTVAAAGVAATTQVAPPQIACAVDLCAAPGGKGIVTRAALGVEFLVGNEVIRKRTAQLISNYQRCAVDPAVVTACDPAVLARLVPAVADLVIVDAPCSGQSMLCSRGDAPGAFHPVAIAMNERRQRRILAQAAKLVAHAGYLVYATCTFAQAENEGNVEWFLETFPDFTAVELETFQRYRSHLSETPCYRLWPQQGEGAGAFCAVLQRTAAAEDCGGAHAAASFMERVRPVWRSPQLVAVATAAGDMARAPESRGRVGRRDPRRAAKVDRKQLRSQLRRGLK